METIRKQMRTADIQTLYVESSPMQYIQYNLYTLTHAVYSNLYTLSHAVYSIIYIRSPMQCTVIYIRSSMQYTVYIHWQSTFINGIIVTFDLMWFTQLLNLDPNVTRLQYFCQRNWQVRQWLARDYNDSFSLRLTNEERACPRSWLPMNVFTGS